MRIVLHGGMHKTGTTSLQQYLSEHRAELLRHGFCYPGADIHHGFAFNFRQIPGLSPLCPPLIEEAERAGAHTLVLSGEVISTLRQDQMDRLSQSLAGHELHFVYCFRHWSTYLPSRWAQYCSRRDSMTLDEYIIATGPDCDFVDRRFDLVLQRALPHGQVTAVSYDNAVASEGTALPATLRAMGLPEDLVAGSALFSTPHNARPNWQFTEIVRLINGAIAGHRDLPLNELFLTLAENRPTCTLFDLSGPISELPVALRSQLQQIVEARRVDRNMGTIAGTPEVEARLNEQYGMLFTNCVDLKVFPQDVSVRVTTCDLDVAEFQQVHGATVDATLAALEPLYRF